jgi:hypothetical protein
VNSIFIGIALLSGLAITLLTIPIDLAFKLERIQQICGHVNIRWLFGLVRFRINIPGSGKTSKGEIPGQPRKPGSTKKTKKPFGTGHLFTALKQSAFRRRLFQFVKDLLRATHPHEVFLRLRIGLGDPADTGQLWALAGPVAAMASSIRSVAVCIEPEFMDSTFEIRSQGKFRLVPLQFVVLVIAFLLSGPSLRAWRVLRQHRV